MRRGFMYLFAIIDVHSRFVVGWSLSNTMSAEWCCSVISDAIDTYGKPEIINSDQGSRFTSEDYVNLLKSNDIKISMDSRGRALDDIFIERLWRSVKQEYVYLNPCENCHELWKGLSGYFDFYNHRRLHQSLGYQCPASVYGVKTPHRFFGAAFRSGSAYAPFRTEKSKKKPKKETKEKKCNFAM